MSIRILFFLLLPSCIFGQNLVPNSHFDNYSVCPSGLNNLNQATPWINPSANSPDFYHTCGNTVPSGLGFYQDDHTLTNGGYIGIYTFTTSTIIPNAREYLQVELTDSLGAGNKYNVSFFVSLTEFCDIATAEIGIYFSDSLIHYSTQSNIPVVPQIENSDTSYLSDFNAWMKVSGVYTAHGGERFITLGNFRDSASTHAVIIGTGGYMLSYYLIDDVSVIPDSIFFIDDNFNNLLSISPNPVTDKLYINYKRNKSPNAVISIYSLTGIRLFSSQITNEIVLEDFSPGFYFIEVIDQNNRAITKFIKR
jgi:OOP family OmpA-OmpF porin